MKIKAVGQSTFIITLPDGTTLMTDPWLAPHFLKNYTIPIDPETLPRCDVMLVSHLHIDHLDSRALRMAKRLGATFVGARKAARRAERRGIKNVIAVKTGDTIQLPGIKCHAVHAEHPLAADAVGFVLEADKTIYFSGDTRLSERLVRDLSRFRIDIALLQSACAVYFFRKDGMDIGDAALLARRIKPGIAIPMHYNDRFRHPDPEDFRKALEDTEIRVDILQPGEEKEY